MKKISLVVDQGADLTPEIIKKNLIEVVPVKLNWPETESLAGENIYQKMRELEKRKIKSFGKTSQPSPKEFLEAYKKQLIDFEEIICITLTSKLSGTYNSALQAKNFLKPEEQKRIFVVDSLSASGGEAFLVLRALNFIKGGKMKAEEIKKKLEVLRAKINLRVIFKDPRWIEASGRISHTVASWIRKIQKLGIQPLLGIKEGIVKPMGIKLGTKDIAVALFKEIKGKTKKQIKENKKIEVIINHGDALKAAQRLKEMIEKELRGTKVLFISLVNDIVGTLAGPDALALTWTED
jgi:DegV family protein with EDD domain